FSEGLEEIADNAFSNCESLTSVTLPKSLTNIADDALGLQLIPDIYDSGMDDYKKYENFQINGYEGSAAQKYAKRWGFQFSIISPYPPAPEFAEGDCGNGISWEFSKDTGILSIKGSGNIPDYSSKEVIPPWQNLSDAITSVVIDDNVTAIGAYSFKGMKHLKEVTLPDTLSNIGTAAFAECSELEAISIPGLVRSIGDSTFSGCKALKELSFSKSLETIGSYAFYGCSSLEKTELPDGISAVGDEAFTNCTSLNYISIPASCNNIGDFAFGYTYNDGSYMTYSPKTTIYGSKCSAAERYAADYDIRFVCTDPEPIATTVCTTTAITTTTAADDTAVRLCSWAVKDYQDRKGITGVITKLLSSSPDNYVIALYDKSGKLLEVYNIDPSTGIGTDSAGYTVDLPQTGNNSPKDLLILAASLAMTLSGLAAVWRSGLLLRKKNEQQ
ncbi:MAG: leucine-rich repeat domain-containing protein, partial [Ruminococcus sp.]|nr:leucine-rich repeat domain-containing protein [Ruminococcus sp.]